jgi:molybdopterin-binding protein
MLSARGLERSYRNELVVSIDALDLAPGSISAVVGPNGSGKSTLLRLLAFLEPPDAGTLSLDGAVVRTPAERRRARRRVTLVDQRPFMFPGTARQNVTYALSLHGVSGATAAHRADAALERLALTTLADRPARTLSEGEIQRLGVARALALKPRVLLLDEPVSGADRAAVRQLHQVLDEERAAGTVLCFASHQIEDAYRWSERVIGLAGGRLSPVTPENLFRAELPEGPESRVIRLGPLQLHVVTDRVGPATIVIPPEDIIVSLAPLVASTRNQFRGRVTKISEDGRGGVTVTVDVGVELLARITRKALDELGIVLGKDVVLAVKAMAVRVY